jgi:hypothetical protein
MTLGLMDTVWDSNEGRGLYGMRALFIVFVLFVVHYMLIQVYPPYRDRMRAFDQKITWITIILVVYLVVNFIRIVFFR